MCMKMNGSYQNFVYSPSLTLSYINDHDKKNKTPLCYMHSRYLLFKVEVLRLTDFR